MFNFKKSSLINATRIENFFITKIVDILKNLFLVILVLIFVIWLTSFSSFSLNLFLFKVLIVNVLFFWMFFELSLFIKFKLLNIKPEVTLKEALLNQNEFNLADFFDTKTTKIILSAINFCQKKKIPASSTAIFYFVVKDSVELKNIFLRLGINFNKLNTDLKNYLEKLSRQENYKDIFANDFTNTIITALKIADTRNKNMVGQKELLVALSKNDELLKKELIDFDLKDTDIENITLWLDYTENLFVKNKEFWSKENLSKYGSLGKDWSSGFTGTLDKYSVDWRDIVSKYIFKEIVGHKKEITETEMILARSNLSNVLLIGQEGTGRKSIVEAVAQNCFLQKSLPELNNKRVVELDMVSLTTSIQSSEILESVLDQIFSEVVASKNVILVIDNLHNFIGVKENKAGSYDISGVITKYLAMPSFQFIGITNYDGLHRNIEQNSTLLDYFRKIEVSEVTETETIEILQNMALEFEKKYKILIIFPAIREIVNLTGRYFPSLPFPKKAIDVLDEAIVYASTLGDKIVLPHHIAKIISDKAQIPVGKIDFKEKEVLLNLENLIHQRIVNQKEAVKDISTAMKRARAGVALKKRPMGSFLFLGPTGVGKTETAKALSQIYFSGENKMIRIDMSEFQAVSDIPRLIGAISPVEMQGLLTTPVRETPFSLVLIDEIEKAHPNILNLFLQILDEGHITDGQGRKVIFTNTIIICTSNAGAVDIFSAVESGKQLDKKKLIDSLLEKNIFRPEFINRFDDVVVFHPLTKENLLDIAKLTLQSLQTNLKEKEINFQITVPLSEKIVELSYKPEFGAREMRRVVQDNIENAIAEAILNEKIKKGDTFQINPENFEVIVSPLN